MVPPSTKQGIDDAVFGVAIWEGVDPKADKLPSSSGASPTDTGKNPPRRRQAPCPLQIPPDRLHPSRATSTT